MNERHIRCEDHTEPLTAAKVRVQGDGDAGLLICVGVCDFRFREFDDCTEYAISYAAMNSYFPIYKFSLM